uniref:Peroxisomal membrane protein PEX16 n=1 Tax=Eptatretus burgeri TaxID=7764 RepID=A0A8C4N1R7_EPTBU
MLFFLTPDVQFLSHRKLRSWLTVIGYLEVVVEMGAGRAGGDHARWLLITAIEITKLVLRSLLLLWYKIGILPSPPIALHKNSKPSGVSRQCPSPHCFLGKRSKRLVRCLDETSLAPHQFCGVSPYEEGEEEELGDHEDNSDDTMPLDRLQTLAESLHIVRPLIHLFIMARLGQCSWTPWVISAALDISSLCLIRNPGVLGCRQRAELRRRTLVLLLYLLRSPCYDRFSEAKILFVLRILADNIPGLSLIISPLMEYLPAWQKVYFYLWD